ncbi:MAG TPA: ABC transporter permease, partial [Saprospiraceae bacterium]|nr:ABC transporter permease [Saprospiraceae bacterium]
RPVEALKSKFRVAGSNLFTKSLVTFQFVLSVGLIACTFIMLRQLHFLQEKNPGFNKENVLVVNAEDADTKRIFPLFKQALSAQPVVAGVASAELGLGAEAGWSRSGFEYEGQQKQVYEYFIDPEYMPVLGMDLLAGRLFDRAVSADTVTSVIINETMMRDFGWTQATATGQELKGYNENGKNNPVVVGVVRDFNFLSLHQDVKPMMFHMFNGYQPFQFFVRLRPGAQAEGIALARKAWTDADPNLPFRYTFLDENLARFYESESRWTTIVGYAGALAVALACLGLFGLVALAALKRTKEIGIRKVLGASVIGIMRLLAADLVRLVLIAIAIATPLAWYVMRRWLSDFAYRIEPGWTYFALAGLSAVLIAVLTVSFHSIRAALANPVKALRSE